MDPPPTSAGSSTCHRSKWIAGGLLVWGAAIAGSLQVHQFQGYLGHGICGPWGCAATPEALLGYHLFMTFLIAPTTVIASWVLPKSTRLGYSVAALVAGVAMTAALAGNAAYEWRRDAESASERAYTLQRAGFVVLTTPDVPALPLTVAGVACLLVNLPRLRTRADHPPRSVAAAAGSPETP